ncbi:MAG: NADH-quinone oxidoreductase subunit NuoF [Candidatus Tectomicrobia bacterium]|uniref:NADH-quinone oxidoreductase subunit F n=1 Tax=Tectimicrobiota bacterium TaxID=2528274 RepID=A0A933E9I8_UNCTE|nr:NADH-quinone oxidoreductase subunit NuoF [Candidatus Tectomicrobia bacterium]
MAIRYEKIVTSRFGDPEASTLAGYEATGGYQAIRKILGKADPKNVIELVKASGLRGRGGAGFPCGLKWSFVPQNLNPKYLAVNGDEGEPGTFKDRELMIRDPHQLIEGIVIACYAVGIAKAYIYIRGEFDASWRAVERALGEAYAKGYVGGNILGGGFGCDIYTHRGAGAYICGEETGLLESLEGKRGHPRLKPPFPAVVGLYGKPTVINNVETLSNLPHIVNNGAEWFAGIGIDEKNTGTRMYCVSGHVERPGLYELPLGLTCEEILCEHAGGVRGGKALKAVIPGGASAPVLTAKEVLGDKVKMDFDALARAGSMGGSGGVIVMDETACMVQAAGRLARFFEHESCGQCSVCREGTGWVSEIMARVESGRGRPDDLATLASIDPSMRGNTICVLSDACALMFGAFLKKFHREFEAHVEQSRCPLGSPYPG